MSAAPTLEDLIPDSAVENPDNWAQQFDQEDAEQPGSEIDLDPDSPMEELPSLAVDWPEDEDLPDIEPLTPVTDEEVRYAELDRLDTLPPVPEADLVKVGSTLTLGFPVEDEAFPERADFVDRFKKLSTIESLGGGDSNIAQLSARARQDEEMLNQLLRVYGYYDGQVLRTLGGAQAGDETADTDPQVRFDILPGNRFKFGAIDLGALDTAPDAVDLRAAFEIVTGDPLYADKIVEEQADLDNALGETGYPFAAIDDPELLVDHDRGEGDLTMPVQPGGKYAFGDVVSKLPDFLSSKHLADIARFEPGDTYQRSLEQDLRRAIIATGLVSSVTIQKRKQEEPVAGDPGTVALDVEMTKAELRTIAGAIGYGTEDGFQIQASWEHRNLFPPEGALKVRGIAGTQQQLAGVTFRRNNFGGRDRILTVDAYATDIDRPLYAARTAALVGRFERVSTLIFQKPLSWSFGLELIATDEREEKVKGDKSPRSTYFIAALPSSALIDTSDSLLDPTEGYRLGVSLSPEISQQSSTTSTYIKAQFDGSFYQKVTESVVLAGRTRIGTIAGAEVFNIAPSRRLYAGGGGSVRGYGYQSIGPRDGNGDPNGGRSLFELSAEARIRTGFMDGAVSVVPFIDAGTVSRSSTPTFDEIKIGAGIGVRYHTGFGPIRVDLGVPLNPGPDDSSFAVYVSLGQAF